MADTIIPRPSKAAKPFLGSREEARLIGTVRYIDGTPCGRNHAPTVRLTSNKQCVDCRDLKSRELLEERKSPRPHGFLAGLIMDGQAVYGGTKTQALTNGAIYYVDPRKPCLHNHVPTIRRVTNGECVACRREWYVEAGPRLNERRRKKRASDPEPIREKRREYYARNPAPYKIAAVRWAAENAERKRETDAEWRAENAEGQKEYWSEWAKTHPENVAAKAHKRRARKLGSAEHFTPDDVRNICSIQGNACAYCWTPFTPKTKATDHFIPLAGKGIVGSNGPENIVMACQACNQRKSNRQPAVFIKADFPRLRRLRITNGEPQRTWPLLPNLITIDLIFAKCSPNNETLEGELL